MQFMLIYIVYSLQYVVYCSILLSRINLQPTWEFLSKRTSGPCRSSVLRLWSEAPLVALVEKAGAVRFSSRQRVNCTWVKWSNDQMATMAINVIPSNFCEMKSETQVGLSWVKWHFQKLLTELVFFRHLEVWVLLHRKVTLGWETVKGV